jgi:Dienelactone hydrolase family
MEGRGGAFGAYIARPKDLPGSAVVVLHEVFGVNADIRKTCDELAEQGLNAVAPDLFWRQEPDVDLSVTSEADGQDSLGLYRGYNRDAGVRDTKDTLDAVANYLSARARLPSRASALATNDPSSPVKSDPLHRHVLVRGCDDHWVRTIVSHTAGTSQRGSLRGACPTD